MQDHETSSSTVSIVLKGSVSTNPHCTIPKKHNEGRTHHIHNTVQLFACLLKEWKKLSVALAKKLVQARCKKARKAKLSFVV